jgi:hypothetical protein
MKRKAEESECNDLSTKEINGGKEMEGRSNGRLMGGTPEKECM